LGRYIPFKLRITVAKIALKGVLELQFTPMAGHVHIGFVEEPEIGITVEVEVTFGFVSMPFQSMVKARIEREFRKAIRKHVVLPNKVRFRVTAKKGPKGVTDEDFQRAQAAAAAAMMRTPVKMQRAARMTGGAKAAAEEALLDDLMSQKGDLEARIAVLSASLAESRLVGRSEGGGGGRSGGGGIGGGSGGNAVDGPRGLANRRSTAE
jgi:hypothetical protein